jgi:5-oxoprolinase (ATP-hydrolysing)
MWSQAYMGHVQDNAAESVARRVLTKLHDSEFTYPMDQGCAIKVKITDRPRQARGDSRLHRHLAEMKSDNFNAPEPVTRAAVLYVFRVMVEDAIPMNAGCLRPIRIIVPDGSMLKPPIRPPSSPAMSRSRSTSPTRCSARWGDAGSQGTMNNLTFGNDQYQYYETICSGSPAGP